FSGHLVTYLAGAGTGGPGRRVKRPGTGDGRPRQGSWTHHDAAESAGRVRNLLVCFRAHGVTGSEFPRSPGAETARPAVRLRSLSSLSPELGDSALCGDVFTLGGFAIFPRTCNGTNVANVPSWEQNQSNEQNPRAVG